MRQDEGDYTRDYPPTLLLGIPSNMMGQIHQSNNEAPSTSNGSNTMPPTVDQIDNIILPSVSGDSSNKIPHCDQLIIIEDISNNTRSRSDVTDTTGNQFYTPASTSDTLDDSSTSKTEVGELRDLLLS